MVLGTLTSDYAPTQREMAHWRFPSRECSRELCMPGCRGPRCDDTGFPPFDRLGLLAERTEPGRALSWEQLRCELLRGRPIAYLRRALSNGQWTGGGHARVATGFDSLAGGAAVGVLDPLPVCLGDRRLVTFAEWQGYKIEAPWHDYFGLRRKGEDWSACSSPAPVPAVEAPLGSVESVVQGVKQSLSDSDWVRQHLGIPEIGELSCATLESIPISSLDPRELAEGGEGALASSIADTGRERILCLAAGQPLSIVYEPTGGALVRLLSVGDPTWTTMLITTLSEVAAGVDDVGAGLSPFDAAAHLLGREGVRIEEIDAIELGTRWIRVWLPNSVAPRVFATTCPSACSKVLGSSDEVELGDELRARARHWTPGAPS